MSKTDAAIGGGITGFVLAWVWAAPAITGDHNLWLLSAALTLSLYLILSNWFTRNWDNKDNDGDEG